MILKDSRFFQRKVDMKKIFFSVLFVSLFIAVTYVAFGTFSAENPENLTKAGLESIRKGNLDEALVKFNKALSQNDRNPMVYVGLGNLYNQKGDTAKAEEAYKQAISIDPKNPMAYQGLAWLYFNSGRKSDYVNAFNKLKELNSDLANQLQRQQQQQPPPQ